VESHSVVRTLDLDEPNLVFIVAFLFVEVVVALRDASLEYLGEVGEGVDRLLLVEVVPVLEDVEKSTLVAVHTVVV